MPFHRVLAVLALAGALAGCHSNPPPPPPPIYPPEVRIDSPDLYGKIGVQIGARVQQDIMFVQCQVTNWCGCPIEVEYQYYWFDATGTALRDPNARWALAQFGPNEFKALDKNAPAPGAVRWEVHFRWPSTIH